MGENYNEIVIALNNLVSDINSTEPFLPELGNHFITPIQKINTDLKPYGKSLKICHINAVSIPKHRDEIKRVVTETNMDIIAVSETNIKKSTPKQFYNLEGYKFFHVDRNHKSKGGVGIYIKEEFKVKKVQVKYECLQPEICFVEIEVHKNKIVIGVIYKSPSEAYSVYGNIVEILAFMTSKYKHVVLLGDFNINQLMKEKPAYKYFLNTIIEPLVLTQLIKEPTRITKTTSTLIDLMLVNSPENVKHTGVTDIPGISDHCMIYCAYELKKKKFIPKIIRRRDFRNFSEVKFKRDLSNAPWGNIYSLEEKDIDNQVTIVENLYNEVINKHAPFREVRVKKPIRASWMSDEIIKLMDKRDKYKNKYNLHKSPLIYDAYRNLKNQVNHMIRKAKIDEMNEVINSKINDSKKIYTALKDKNIVSAKIINEQNCQMDPDGLNETFINYNNAEVNADMIEKEIRRINTSSSDSSFEFRQVTEKEVKLVVKSLKSNACGIDEISAFFIKMGIEYSVHAITEIMNASLKYHYFPKRWKKALVKPIPKCQDPREPTDFRPISLLVVLSKILEKLVAAQMKSYFEANNLLDHYQSAYRENHSTTTALLEIMECINKALDNSEVTILALLDYSKAFDCANHKLIIAKLKAFGFKDTALKWIRSYLSNRSQQVITDKGKSNWKYLSNGVPQGSILGPLLFTVLISDLWKTIKYCTHHCYADDTQIFISDKIINIVEMVEKMNNDLNEIAKFSKNNCLKLNSKKTTYVIIGSAYNLKKLDRLQLPNIHIDNQIIERKSNVRNLGVIIDENLLYDKHINATIAKSFMKLKQAYMFKKFLSRDSRKRIVESYILSNFNYCDALLTNISKQLSKKIQKLQNTCTRFIFDLKKYDHIQDSFLTLDVLNMENRRKLHMLTLMHKIINKRAPIYMSSRIKYTSNVHSHNTRGKNKLIQTKSKNNYGYNSFFNYAANCYNCLTDEMSIDNKMSDLLFKKKCKALLLYKQRTDDI